MELKIGERVLLSERYFQFSIFWYYEHFSGFPLFSLTKPANTENKGKQLNVRKYQNIDNWKH